jgi:hypothetical protein
MDPARVEEAIFGSAGHAGNGPNPARQIRFRSGVPKNVQAHTVNQAGASGVKAIALGFQTGAVSPQHSALSRQSGLRPWKQTCHSEQSEESAPQE